MPSYCNLGWGFRSPIFLLTENNLDSMEKSQWLGPALFSIVAGLLGVMLIPFQQSCPPEPPGVQCSGYVTPAIDLALLYASAAAIIGGIATLGLLTFQWARAKNLGKGSFEPSVGR